MKVADPQEVPVTRDDENSGGFQGAFEDAVVVRISRNLDLGGGANQSAEFQ